MEIIIIIIIVMSTNRVKGRTNRGNAQAYSETIIQVGLFLFFLELILQSVERRAVP